MRERGATEEEEEEPVHFPFLAIEGSLLFVLSSCQTKKYRVAFDFSTTCVFLLCFVFLFDKQIPIDFGARASLLCVCVCVFVPASLSLSLLSLPPVPWLTWKRWVGVSPTSFELIGFFCAC